ncbi:glutaredoxin 3 [Nematocida parisii]|eukprot:XP_013059069.1 hypothetical protein NEPG_01241 [Nematocida parisii ERTm1]
MAEVSGDVKEHFKSLILGTPIFAAIKTSCPFCVEFLNTINRLNYSNLLQTISEVNHAPLLEKLKEITYSNYGHKTFPMIFINGRFIGGNDSFNNVLSKIKSIMNMKQLDRSLVLTPDGRYTQ